MKNAYINFLKNCNCKSNEKLNGNDNCDENGNDNRYI